MATPKAKTVIERFGFMDSDLKSANHDEIMMWLDDNCERIVNELFPSKLSMDDLVKAVDRMNKSHWQKVKVVLEENLGIVPSEESKVDIIKKIWEEPIYSGKFNIGFVDLMAYTRYKYFTTNNDLSKNMVISTSESKIAFEVKTEIKSLGELIRQIRMYEGHLNVNLNGIKFVIVSPDDSYKDRLMSQGIYFYKYK